MKCISLNIDKQKGRLSVPLRGGGVNMPVAYWLERSEEAHAQHGGGVQQATLAASHHRLRRSPALQRADKCSYFFLNLMNISI